ncbi:MAG: 50S ribosomal protein L10 [Truepera sp.]|jgi:large subunit ribosomal protein L10|nr:50S ribosomal protein L10 [Truepera sp.]HRN18140.1 50S ribosomal protein L10 [Trueperaceae bacterium]HRQ09633.1 50S ribosomal protein L10 [Trueperaceae bacterium]
MANPRNEAAVSMLREQLGDAKTFFLVDYQGLSAGDLGRLRAAVREAGGRILVAKNTLINVVLKEQGIEGFEATLQGPTALVLVGDEVVAPAKAITEFAKAHPRDLPRSKGGRLEGSVLGEDALVRIAKLPSKQQIQSQLVGVLAAPLQQLVGLLEGPQRNLVTVMNNYADKMKDGGN